MKAHEKRKETTEGEMLRLMISTPTAKSNTLSQMLDSDSPPCYTASTAVSTGPRPIEDSQQAPNWSIFPPYRLVRPGPRPIEGLHPPIVSMCGLTQPVRTGPRPIEG